MGIGTDVIDNIKIGNNVIAGAGSVILKDLDDDLTVAGVPAKII